MTLLKTHLSLLLIFPPFFLSANTKFYVLLPFSISWKKRSLYSISFSFFACRATTQHLKREQVESKNWVLRAYNQIWLRYLSGRGALTELRRERDNCVYLDPKNELGKSLQIELFFSLSNNISLMNPWANIKMENFYAHTFWC